MTDDTMVERMAGECGVVGGHKVALDGVLEIDRKFIRRCERCKTALMVTASATTDRTGDDHE